MADPFEQWDKIPGKQVRPSNRAGRVSGFTGPYRPFSNFWYATVAFEGREYATNEHAFQAAKSWFPDERAWVAAAERPGEAKKRGRRLAMRADWEDVKIEVMRALCREKFTRHSELRDLLLSTGEAELIETNTWGDRFWGRDPQGNGENWLGRVLMEVRAELTGKGD